MTAEAERDLSGLQEWLHFALRRERGRRRDRRYLETCWRRTWFCYWKYEEVRRSLFYDAARQTVSVQTGSLQSSPATTL